MQNGDGSRKKKLRLEARNGKRERKFKEALKNRGLEKMKVRN